MAQKQFWPTIQDNHPIHKYEARNLPWGRTFTDLTDRTLRWVSWILGIGLLFWSFFFLFSVVTENQEDIFDFLWSVVGLLFLLSLADKFILDFIGVTSGLDSINREMREGRWDLISISNLSTREIVHAKHIAAQIRAWRMTTRIVALRLTVVLLAILNTFIFPLFLGGAIEFNTSSTESLLLILLGLAASIITSGIYIIEPRWRLRTLAAASIAISSRQHETTMSMLSAFGAMIGVWATQIIMAIAAMFMLWFTSIAFFSDLIAGVFMVVYVLGVGVIIYNLYDSLTSRWLNRTYRRLVARGGTP